MKGDEGLRPGTGVQVLPAVAHSHMLSCSGLTVILRGTPFADEETVQRGEAICRGHTAWRPTVQSKGPAVGQTRVQI